MQGAQAVARVRAGGFVAAIEPIESELPEGTVIEQEPPAGAPLQREAVITLRLAIPRLDATPAATETGEEPTSRQTGRTGDPDDTEEWFAALALSGRDARHGAAPGRRRRKHRHLRPSTREFVFDSPPQPRSTPTRPAAPCTPSERPDWQSDVLRHMVPAMSVAIAALSPLPWRRVSALLAGLLLCVLVGMRLFASNDRRAQSTDHRALARATRAQVAAENRVGRNLPLPRGALRPARKPDTGHSRPRAARHRARARKANAAPPATIADQHPHQPQTAAAPATTTTAARPASGQFAYLGQ
jgi:hypothetical protein